MFNLIVVLILFVVSVSLLFIFLVRREMRFLSSNDSALEQAELKVESQEAINLDSYQARLEELKQAQEEGQIDDELFADLDVESKKMLLTDIPKKLTESLDSTSVESSISNTSDTKNIGANTTEPKESQESQESQESKEPTETINFSGLFKKSLMYGLFVGVIACSFYGLVFYEATSWQWLQDKKDYASAVERSVATQKIDDELKDLSVQQVLSLFQAHALADLKAADRWKFLGFILLQLEAYPGAEKALAKAYRASPNIEVGKLYVETMVRQSGGKLTPKLRLIFNELLVLAPEDLSIVLAQASIYYSNQEYQTALDLWQGILDKGALNQENLNEEAVRGQAILQGYIAKAKREMKSAPGKSVPLESPDAQSNSSENINEMTNVKLNVFVRLDSSVKLPQSGYFWLVVKAKSGFRAPLAVKKIAVSEMPELEQQLKKGRIFELGAEDAMLPQHTINDYQDLEITARVSLTDQVKPQEEDWLEIQIVDGWAEQEMPISINLNSL